MDFQYRDIRFADIEMLRYEVTGFDDLTPQQRTFIYHLSEAALWGRDILWHQHCHVNLDVRTLLETLYTTNAEARRSEAFCTYLRRVWFANGIHHHYSMDKFQPAFTRDWLLRRMQESNVEASDDVLLAIFDEQYLSKRVSQAVGTDLITSSACNFYGQGVTQAMAEEFYDAQRVNDTDEPVMHGMNSRLELVDGRLQERTWHVGGMYGPTIERIVEHLRAAQDACENEAQRTYIATLIDFYETGDLATFDRYCIQWLSATEGDVDFVNGFIETYGDPLGLKASWEGYVNIRDHKASRRTATLSSNAQWFEDNSPVDPRFKKSKCRGVSAKVVEAVQLGGDLYPASAIGINLPNSNWVRAKHGSKSVTIGNLTRAYARAARGNGMREEFVGDDTMLRLITQYDDALDDLHTDLHECLGHGSGRLLEGVSPDALKSYGSTIEEARADLFALHYIATQRLVDLGLTPDATAYRAQYFSYMLNGLITQLVRIEPGQQIEEAHMRNRALIAHWCLANTQGMSLTKRQGKTYLVITDFDALRCSVARLLAEVQRIKSEGDIEAAQALVETYAVSVDPALHAEVIERYQTLNLAPYKGFINPRLTPIRNEEGHVVDARITYGEPYDEQMLRLSQHYSLGQA